MALSNSSNKPNAHHLLDIIEHRILPLTAQGVTDGNKVFGAAVVCGEEVINIATNHEHSEGCPLWHGEMVAIRDFYALPNHPAPQECTLLSTHEPCPMCAAAIAWGGFGQCYYLFDYEDTKQQFSIPHDADILHDLFHPCTALNQQNGFYKLSPLKPLVDDTARLDALWQSYRDLSHHYQTHKGGNAIPLK